MSSVYRPSLSSGFNEHLFCIDNVSLNYFSGESTVLLLEREDAVSGWRALMGPTDPDEAREKAPDS